MLVPGNNEKKLKHVEGTLSVTDTDCNNEKKLKLAQKQNNHLPY